MRGVCVKCLNCLVPATGVCPIMPCAKGLINGPCGGAGAGKCEINTAKNCIWCMVIPKLKGGRVPVSSILAQLKDYSVVKGNGF